MANFQNYPPTALPGRIQASQILNLNAIGAGANVNIVAAGTFVVLTGFEIHLSDIPTTAAGVDSTLRCRIMDAALATFAANAHFGQLAGGKFFPSFSLMALSGINQKLNGLAMDALLLAGAGWTAGSIRCNVWYRLPYPNE